MVLDQRLGAACGVADRLPMTSVCDPRREGDRPLERGEIVAERIRPALGVEADRWRDVEQEVVAGNQDAVAEEAQMPVRVSG